MILIFNGILNPSEELVINLQNYTAKIGTLNALKSLSLSDFLVFLESGTNQVTYTGNTPVLLSFEYNERWR
ncbi:hypothetical protein P9E76_15505 [Schinkia azotoformans]|uniref:Siphovirus-type tail component C-terminal domain-containing protein n=1 Tax=Schinkia azotoformans LMG 9581 TaxID=1131731 RepID=K6CAE3_SCHAZ|nr:hypothetical protein [Schinkia azotoformans]EKN68080.1 hypothetical protein BAZO_06169 [Schinkia azotoformans LMG 9581]MEC1638115.1 hypothetical protein [Schinkia azotoformans]MEC1946451.1 hypothetical protein [Schinkia azotoformans]